MVESVFGLTSFVVTTICFLPVAFVLFKVTSVIARICKLYKVLNQFPAPSKHWLNGSRGDIKHPGPEWMQRHIDRATEFKDAYVHWHNGFLGVLLVTNPDLIKVILKQADPKSMGYHASFQKWLGEGLLTSSGKKWARSRRLLTPAFHFEVLKPYMKVYNEAADILITKISEDTAKGQSFDVFKHVSLCALDIILRCAFSQETNCQTMGQRHPYIQGVYELGKRWYKQALSYSFFMFPSFYYLFNKEGREFVKLCDFVHSESEKIIEERRIELEKNPITDNADLVGKRYLDFLDILLMAKDEEGNGMAPRDIRDEVDTFLFEGHDTTSSGMSWTLYLMAKYPEIRKKCQEEIDAIMAGKENKDIEWEDLAKMKYLSLCLKEALRMYPPVIMIGRELTSDLEIGGKKLCAGLSVNVPIWALHHSSNVWGDDHMDFKPERFLPENMKDMNSFAYLPFSAGPRNCIGQHFALNEEKVVIAKLLHRFDFSIAADSAEALPNFVIILRFEKEVRLQAKLREPAT